MSSANGKKKGGGKRWALYVSVLLGTGIVWLVNWSANREFGVVFDQAPPETLGTWTSTNPRYAGRALVVTPKAVTLHVGNGGSVPGQLDLAREIIDNGVRILRLEYQTANGPDQIDMVVSEAGTMYMANQPEVVWSVDRSPGSAPPAPPAPAPVVERQRPNPVEPGTVLLVMAVLMVVGLLILLRALRARGEGVLDGQLTPKLVRGVWTTPDPRFEGRSIRIAYQYGFAHFGPGDIRIGGHIAEVRQWKEDGARVVSLGYQTADGIADLEMVIDGSGHMRLRDGPKSVWVRRAS